MELSQIALAIWSTKLNCFRKSLKLLLETWVLAVCRNNIHPHAENEAEYLKSIHGFQSDPHNTFQGKNYHPHFQRQQLSLKERGPLSHHTAGKWPRCCAPHVAAADMADWCQVS